LRSVLLPVICRLSLCFRARHEWFYVSSMCLCKKLESLIFYIHMLESLCGLKEFVLRLICWICLPFIWSDSWLWS
jgi:hypothetical protein